MEKHGQGGFIHLGERLAPQPIPDEAEEMDILDFIWAHAGGQDRHQHQDQGEA